MSVLEKIPAPLVIVAGIALGVSVPVTACAVLISDLGNIEARGYAAQAQNSELITQMVKAGAAPIEAACALGRIDPNAPVCVMSLMSATPADAPLPETLSPGGEHPGDPT
ncbi:hypothetical protein HW537_14565 [Asaia siamensis]